MCKTCQASVRICSKRCVCIIFLLLDTRACAHLPRCRHTRNTPQRQRQRLLLLLLANRRLLKALSQCACACIIPLNMSIYLVEMCDLVGTISNICTNTNTPSNKLKLLHDATETARSTRVDFLRDLLLASLLFAIRITICAENGESIQPLRPSYPLRRVACERVCLLSNFLWTTPTGRYIILALCA